MLGGKGGWVFLCLGLLTRKSCKYEWLDKCFSVQKWLGERFSLNSFCLFSCFSTLLPKLNNDTFSLCPPPLYTDQKCMQAVWCYLKNIQCLR